MISLVSSASPLPLELKAHGPVTPAVPSAEPGPEPAPRAGGAGLGLRLLRPPEGAAEGRALSSVWVVSSPGKPPFASGTY